MENQLFEKTSVPKAYMTLALPVVLSSVHDELYLKRSMGVVAALFVILIIPELWKNRSCECMEIEAVSYYSLKQVYAARMLLFGVTDMFFITLFLGAASAGLHYAVSELVVQFLFPLCITACICFGILCSKHSFSETVAITLCVIWSAVWLFIVLNENLYVMVTVPIWSALLSAAILFLGFFDISYFTAFSSESFYLRHLPPKDHTHHSSW